MVDRKSKLLIIVFVGLMLLLALAWWTNRPSEAEQRVGQCVELLGPQSRERCEAIEAGRAAGEGSSASTI